MFNQIIYTRCKPGRNIESHGDLDRADGHKIRSFSQEIYDILDKKEIQLLSKQYISARNESKTGTKQGLIDSFEYITIRDLSVFAYQHQREKDEDKRPGTFVKHYYIGNINDYPLAYMNKELYSYTQLPVEYYYAENETSEFLPTVELSPSMPYSLDDIKAFYQMHKDAIHKAISFVIEQQSSTDKKFLVIKDDSENVLKWIACITCAFPLELSKQISFSTNAKIEKGNPGSFQYCLDKDNNYVKYMNNPNLTKHLSFDIIGISPLTSSANGFKSTMNSPFVVIDGATNEAEFEVEYHNDYLSFACQYELKDFNEILNYFDHYDFKDLYEVYDIYQYLFKADSMDQWNYDQLIQYLQLSQKYIIPGSVLEKNLSCALFESYHEWYQEDASNSYQLLSYIYKTSITSQNSGYQKSVLETIFKYVDIIMDYDNLDINKMNTFWQFVRNDESLYQVVSDYYFDESKVFGYIRHLTDIYEEIAVNVGCLMISILNDYLQRKGLNKELLENNQGLLNYLYNLYVLILSEGCPNQAYNLVSSYNEEIMNLITMKFSKSKGFNVPVTKNWISLYGSTIDMHDLYHQCESMLKSGVHPKAVELLITTYMEKQEQTNDELLKSFKLLLDYLDNDKTVGEAFFEKYVELVCQSKDKYREIGRLLKFVREEKFPISIQRNLAIKVDNIIPIIPSSRVEEQFITDYFEWCKELKEYGVHTLKAMFGMEVKDVRKSNLDKFMEKVHNNHLSIKFDEKEYLDIFIQNIAPLIEGPGPLNNACYMFDTDKNTRQYMVEKYFKLIAKRTRRDVYAIYALGYYCVTTKDYEEISAYAKKQGKMDLAENFKVETWQDCIQAFRNKEMQKSFHQLCIEISELNNNTNPTEKLKKGLKKFNLFNKK